MRRLSNWTHLFLLSLLIVPFTTTWVTDQRYLVRLMMMHSPSRPMVIKPNLSFSLASVSLSVFHFLSVSQWTEPLTLLAASTDILFFFTLLQSLDSSLNVDLGGLSVFQLVNGLFLNHRFCSSGSQASLFLFALNKGKIFFTVCRILSACNLWLCINPSSIPFKKGGAVCFTASFLQI